MMKKYTLKSTWILILAALVIPGCTNPRRRSPDLPRAAQGPAGNPVDPELAPRLELGELSLETLGVDAPSLSGFPAISADGARIMELEQRFCYARFTDAAEEEEPFTELHVVLRALPDRREIRRWAILTEEEVRLAQRDAKDPECLRENAVDPEEPYGSQEPDTCERIPERGDAALARLRPVLQKRLDEVRQEARVLGARRLDRMFPAGEDTKDHEVVYEAKDVDHRTPVRVLRVAGNVTLAQTTLACEGLPESSCDLSADLEVYWSATHRLVWLHASERDAEDGRSKGEIYRVLRLDGK